MAITEKHAHGRGLGIPQGGGDAIWAGSAGRANNIVSILLMPSSCYHIAAGNTYTKHGQIVAGG